MTQYSNTQLAKKLNCDRSTIHNIAKRYSTKGGIPGAKRVGHFWTFNEESEAFVKGLLEKANRKPRKPKAIKGE